MKRILAFVLLAIFVPGLFAGCGRAQDAPEGEKLKIVATIFPLYDWTRNVLGGADEKSELTLLMNRGVDLHSFQPAAADIVKISSCDLFLYVGGESDEWVDDVLGEVANPRMRVINLMELLGDRVREEEIRGGMEEENGDGEEESETDEHVWLSLRNAALFTEAIAKALSELVPEEKDRYEKNAREYAEKLSALDEAYEKAVKEAPGKTLLFADRFPFRYMTEDYGLEYYAAFPGCSAETEASFETVVFLAKKTDEMNLPAVLVTESSDRSMARTVMENTAGKDREILVLDSLQSADGSEAAGDGYLARMKSNLDVLRKALGAKE